MKILISKSKVRSKGRRASRGFTLIETLVAVAVLMIAVAGPLTVAEKGLSASIYAKNQMMATYLAQDAAEYLKNLVDGNVSRIDEGDSGLDWLSYPGGNGSPGTLSQCTQGDPCTADTLLGGIVNVNGNTCNQAACPLYLTSKGYEQYSANYGTNDIGGNINAAADTVNFTRTFYLVPFDVSVAGSNLPDKGAELVVDVAWPGETAGGGGVTLTDTLFDIPQ